MAKKLRFLFTLLFVMAATVSWGEDYTYDFSTGGLNQSSKNTWTTDFFTILQEKGNSATAVANYLTAPRWYQNHKITFTPANNIEISKIVINCSSSNNGQTISPSIGSVSANGNNSTWTGKITSSNPLVLIMGKQCRPTSIIVTYTTSGSSGPVDPDVSFANQSVEVKVGSTITNEITKPTDLTVTYSSNDKSIATVDADGVVTGVAAGETTIIAKWDAVENIYNAGSVEFNVTVKDLTPQDLALLYESWSNSGATVDGTTELKISSSNLDYKSWAEFSKLYQGAGACGKLGTSSLPGFMKTGSLNLNGEGVLTFKIKKYGNDTGKLKVTVTGASINGNAEFTPESKNSWTDCEVNITGAEGNVIITLATTANRMYIDDIMLIKQLPSAVATPTFSPDAGPYFEAQSVTITCATEGAAIYYTTDGTEPTTSSTEYKDAIEISETKTLKAIAVKGEDLSEMATATYTIILTTGKGLETDPYTVADVNKILTAGVTPTEVYVKGIVSQINEINTTEYKNATYYISDDGSTQDQFYVFRGKNINNTDFTSENQLKIGDEVVIKGNLIIYGNDKVFEFAKDNYIVSLFRPVAQIGEVKYESFAEAVAALTETNNVITLLADIADPYKLTEGQTLKVKLNGHTLTVKAPEGFELKTTLVEDVTTYSYFTPVAQIGNQKFETLQAAFAAAADGATITLLANCFGNGIVVAEGKYTNGLTVDFGGYTFTVDGATVGSTGTETQAFQLLRNNNITFKNGTITSEKAKILVQNYSNLTLEKMTLTLANEGYAYGYTLSNNNGKIKIDNSTIKANTGGGFAFDVCRYSSYPSVEVTVTGESVINGNVEVFASDNDAKDGFKLMLESGKINGDIVIDASASAAMSATPDKAIIMENDSFGQAAPEGYKWESNGDGTSTLKKVTAPAVVVSAPVVFHDSGEYEAGLSVPMYAQAGAKIYYTTDGSEPTTASTEYTGALKIENATTLKAIAVLDGVPSAVVTREYTIKAAAAEIEAIDGYYSIKNNGNEKYINVAGRKTVTFVADGDEADKAGTVLKVKTGEKGQVEVLRSQGVDLPGYADRAMNYVPKFVKLIVDKLHAEGSGEILGANGLDAIMQKFNDSFDYHLYVEKADAGYRIYGKTPSMKPVVDFYAENKDNVDYKLPQLEAFINSAIQKVLQKTGGRGASILTEFKLHDIWQKMGETLTEPVKDDAASIAKFYEEVLASEANVWNFAYQTAMTYWTNVKSHPRYEELKGKLGEYANYIEKVENIRPDFKYYIVANTAGNDVDFISEGNTDINAARATWTLEKRTDFKVTFDPENVKNGGTEYYATLYTDFGYELADGMKAYKVTEVDSKGYAKLEEIGTQIPAQTPVLLMTTDLSKTTLTVKDGGNAVTGNLLVGPDYLINEYEIKTAQVEGLFNIAKDIMGDSFYDNYVKEYEHLMLRNAGTVNNKYFFGLDAADVEKCVYGSDDDCVVRNLSNGEKRLGFYDNWKVEANKAFIVSEKFNPVKLTKVPDVNRDGLIDVNDVTATVDIILGKDSAVPYKFDHDAADVNNSNSIDVNDVTGIVDIVLGKKTIE